VTPPRARPPGGPGAGLGNEYRGGLFLLGTTLAWATPGTAGLPSGQFRSYRWRPGRVRILSFPQLSPVCARFLSATRAISAPTPSASSATICSAATRPRPCRPSPALVASSRTVGDDWSWVTARRHQATTARRVRPAPRAGGIRLWRRRSISSWTSGSVMFDGHLAPTGLEQTLSAPPLGLDPPDALHPVPDVGL